MADQLTRAIKEWKETDRYNAYMTLEEFVTALVARVEELDQKVLDVILDATNTPITKEVNEAYDRAAMALLNAGRVAASEIVLKLKEDIEHGDSKET